MKENHWKSYSYAFVEKIAETTYAKQEVLSGQGTSSSYG